MLLATRLMKCDRPSTVFDVCIGLGFACFSLVITVAYEAESHSFSVSLLSGVSLLFRRAVLTRSTTVQSGFWRL